VVVNYSGGADWQCAGAISYTGAKQSGQPDAWLDEGPFLVTSHTLSYNCGK